MNVQQLQQITDLLSPDNRNFNNLLKATELTTGKTAQELLELPTEKLILLIGNTLEEINNLKPQEIKELPVIMVGGVRFSPVDFDDFSTREFIDFEYFAEKTSENMSLLLALMYSPTNEQGEKREFSTDYREEMTQRAAHLRLLDAQTAVNCLAFFLRWLQACVVGLPDYLTGKTPKKTRKKNKRKK